MLLDSADLFYILNLKVDHLVLQVYDFCDYTHYYMDAIYSRLLIFLSISNYKQVSHTNKLNELYIDLCFLRG